MQTYNVNNDKSIEYIAVLTTVKNKLQNLKNVKVDTTDFEKRVEVIEDKLRRDINNSVEGQKNGVQALATSSLEYIYQSAISELHRILPDTEVYEIYIEINNQIRIIEEIIDKQNITDEDLDILVRMILEQITKINYSNTRDYDSQKNIVENLYNIAFQIIKLEYIQKGSSIVLNKLSNDSLTMSFINTEISKEIERYILDNPDDELFMLTLNQTISINTDYPFLDEKIILYLILNNNENNKEIKNQIESRLIELNKRIVNLEENLKSTDRACNAIKNDIKKGKRSYATIFAYFGLVAALSVGAIKCSKVISGLRFRTNVNYFTTGAIVQTALPEEYSPHMSDSLSIYEYKPWELTDNGYSREYTVYKKGSFANEIEREKVNNVIDEILAGINQEENLQRLEGYAYFSQAFKTKNDIETRETLDDEDFYDKTIVELVQIHQGEFAFVEEDNINILLAFIIWSLGHSILFGTSSLIEHLTNLHLLRKSISTIREFNKEELEEQLNRQVKLLNEYAEKNKEFKKKFIDLFNKFKEQINNEEIEQSYQVLTKSSKDSLHKIY